MNKLLCVGILIGFIVHEGWSQDHIDLCDRNMTAISKETKEIKDLPKNAVFIALCENNLTTISSDTFTEFSELDKLSLDDNRELNFHKNRIFLESSSLTKLHCIGCGIDQLYNRSLEKLPSLEQINLTFNEISIIEPGAFGKNRKLEEVYLKHNKLREIPKEMIEDLQNLRSIDLSHNYDLAPIDHQPFLISDSLKELKCESCSFSVIYEQTFSELTSLIKLNLRDNKISQIYEPSFSLQVSLKELNLQNNRLTMLDRNLFERGIKICVHDNSDELQCFIKNNEIQTNCSETFQKIVDCPQKTTTTATKTKTTTEMTQPDILSVSTVSAENSTLVIRRAEITSTTIPIFSPTTTIKPTTLEPAPPLEVGISNAYISGYLTLIYLAQITMLIFLIGIWLKLKKYDSDPEVDQYADNILNPNPIYKAIY